MDQDELDQKASALYERLCSLSAGEFSVLELKGLLDLRWKLGSGWTVEELQQLEKMASGFFFHPHINWKGPVA